jgi:hypothetical protein
MSQGASTQKVLMNKIKSKLLNPSLTSFYVCNFGLAPGLPRYLKNRVSDISPSKLFDRLTLACSDATLPGSSLATIDINNDYHGVSEKHSYRRLYDDRADFSFYVDAEEYYAIKLFESWIGYTVNEQYLESRKYSYRANYPVDYCTDELSITKFEKNHAGSRLQYNFVKAFPISIQSMPVSYEASQLLKCTVSFTYSRYWISSFTSSSSSNTSNTNASGVPDLSRFSDPNLQASYNRLTNPLSGQGYNDSPLDQAALRALTPTNISDININTFQNG